MVTKLESVRKLFKSVRNFIRSKVRMLNIFAPRAKTVPIVDPVKEAALTAWQQSALVKTNAQILTVRLCYDVAKLVSDLEVSEELKQEALNLLETVRTDLNVKTIEEILDGEESLKLILEQLYQLDQANSDNFLS
jgi:hypothetical protein